ncbi:MAG: VCBS repeat-containing protein [Flavobacteriales bacterium]|jgi:hypothetical protein
MKHSLLPVLITMCLLACNSGTPDQSNPEAALFELVPSTQSGIHFTNHAEETDSMNVFNYEYIFNGGGVAIGDINNDGLNDIYFSGSDVPNRLYLNQGDFRFTDITESSGTSGGRGHKTGVVMADINQDGWLDIHVCRSASARPEDRTNILYINNQDGTFTDKAAEFGLNDPGYSTQAHFHDFDLDGDLDLYLINHPANWRVNNQVMVNYDETGRLVRFKPTQFEYISDRYYANEGGHYTDRSAEAGVLNNAFGLSATVLDANQDGLPDIYVCNDYIEPDYLYINLGQGRFREAFDQHFSHSSFSSMGSDAGDLDLDGLDELVTLDMVAEDNHYQKMLQMAQNYDKFQSLLQYGYQPQFSINTVQKNHGNGQFSDYALLAGMAYTDWSWAPLLMDFDLDGLRDVFITNGYRYDVSDMDYSRFRFDSLSRSIQLQGGNLAREYRKIVGEHKVKNYFFRNRGEWSFEPASDIWNSGTPSFSNGAAWGDLDNDGDPDLVVNNLEDEAFVMRNRAERNGHHYLRIMAEGPAGNREGIGLRVVAETEPGTVLAGTLTAARGFLSSCPAEILLGTGTYEQLSTLRMIWPDGREQQLTSVAADTTLIVRYSDARLPQAKKTATPVWLVQDDAALTTVHAENEFIDFKREPLLHREFSSQGPCMASGDVNGDGLDDAFIGGSAGHAGALFVQQPDGRLTASPRQPFGMHKASEDADATFLDADGDGDQDLLVVSGGTEHTTGDSLYTDRLYLNDGRGLFSHAPGSIPAFGEPGSCAEAADVDGDGDTDLFRGAWVTPGRYPLSGTCRILINERGRFTDASSQWLAGLKPRGIPSLAQLADFDGDGKSDLALAGEWMSPLILLNTGSSFTAIAQPHDDSHTGWWSSMSAADPDRDGDMDLIAGNLGLNTRLQASASEPVTLHAADFDSNESMDAILSLYIGGTSYPIHLRDAMLDQITALRRRFLRYADYADVTTEELFPDQLDEALRYEARMMQSCYFENDGRGVFTARTLPRMAQTSCVRGIAVEDVDGDGNDDLVLTGNMYETDVQNSRYDASIGLVLKGDGKGGFESVPSTVSGLHIPGNTRGVITLMRKDGKLLIAGVNDGPVRAFRIRSAPVAQTR